ncbi:TPA: recQ-mediated genome instability protein 1, variant 2 [Trebouxia sp. C0005]
MVVGLEYRHIRDFHVLMSAGAKIAIKDVTVRRGTLLLMPDNTVVLGGQVENLENARQQALKRWSQPVCELHFTTLNRLPMPLHNSQCYTKIIGHHILYLWCLSLSPVSISIFVPVGAQHSMTAARKSTVSLVLDAHDLHCAAGRTSRNEAGPVDLYAEASAAAWESQPPFAQSSGPQPHVGVRPGLGNTDALQTQPGPVFRAGQPDVTIQSAQTAVSARLGSTLSHQTLLGPSHPNTPFTPPDQLQQQQQRAHHSSQLHNRSLNSYGVNSIPIQVTPGAVTTAARVQSASQLGPPRTSRLALTRTAAATTLQSHPPAATPHQQPSDPSGPSPSTAGPTPRQQQPPQELIIIDDSPQLPRAQPRQQPSSDQPQDMVDDTDDNAMATQPGKRQKRQLLESSSDSETDHVGLPRPTRTVSHMAADPNAPSNADDIEDKQGNENADPADLCLRYPHDIVPDSCADMGGMPEAYEDYGNEPTYENEDDELVDYYEEGQDPGAYGDDALASVDDAEQDEPMEDPSADALAATEGHHGDGQNSDVGQEGLGYSDAMSDGSAGWANEADTVANKQHMQAMEVLFSPPHTSLSLMTKHAPHMLASEYPITLRINGKIMRTMSKLAFKNSVTNEPLSEYAIDVELQDATAACLAVLGHEVLSNAIGVPPADFTAANLSGGRGAVAPYLQKMSVSMKPYFESFTLMDIQLQKADAKPVVSAFHGGWTEADKAALPTH